MVAAMRVLGTLLLLVFLPACGLRDCAGELLGPDIECLEGEAGPVTLELQRVNDELSCVFFESMQQYVEDSDAVWIEEASVGIQGQGGHPCHLVSHDRVELSRTVQKMNLSAESLIALGEDLPVDGKPTWKAYLLETPAVVTGAHVKKAFVRIDENMMAPVVMVHLTDEGARLFEELTARITGSRLAIVVNGEVLSAPIVRERIPGGKLQITLGTSGTHEELYCRGKALADALNGE